MSPNFSRGYRLANRTHTSYTQDRNLVITARGFGYDKALIFGVIQVLTGIGALILGVVAVPSRAWGYRYGSGFWGGCVYLLAGAFGLASARKKTQSTVIVFMVLSIMGTTIAMTQLALAALGIASDHLLFYELKVYEGSALVVHCMFVVVSIVEIVTGSMASVLGCKTVCASWYQEEDIDFANIEHHVHYAPPGSHNFMPSSTNHMRRSNIDCHSSLIDAEDSNDLSRDSNGFSLHNADGVSLQNTAGQQIAYIPMPTSSGSMFPRPNTYVMQASNVSSGFRQIMYVMPTSSPCPQPGTPSMTENRAPGTPPPSYSTLNLSHIESGIAGHVADTHHSPDNGVCEDAMDDTSARNGTGLPQISGMNTFSTSSIVNHPNYQTQYSITQNLQNTLSSQSTFSDSTGEDASPGERNDRSHSDQRNFGHTSETRDDDDEQAIPQDLDIANAYGITRSRVEYILRGVRSTGNESGSQAGESVNQATLLSYTRSPTRRPRGEGRRIRMVDTRENMLDDEELEIVWHHQ